MKEEFNEIILTLDTHQMQQLHDAIVAKATELPAQEVHGQKYMSRLLKINEDRVSLGLIELQAKNLIELAKYLDGGHKEFCGPTQSGVRRAELMEEWVRNTATRIQEEWVINTAKRIQKNEI
ncbi:MAG: hypothetical protein GY765_22575 [bacterium]|nr:hypothetical protein [bacterium]